MACRTPSPAGRCRFRSRGFYKWRDRPPTRAARRRAALDAAVRASFGASGATYESPRVHADLVAEGWRVSVNTVAASMAGQQLVARVQKRRVNLTRSDKKRRPFPDLVRRDFTAPRRTSNGWGT